MALFDTTSFRIAEQGLQLLSLQQQVIAQNIANQDTPDYKCKYLYFAAVLKDKLDEKGKKTTICPSCHDYFEECDSCGRLCHEDYMIEGTCRRCHSEEEEE